VNKQDTPTADLLEMVFVAVVAIAAGVGALFLWLSRLAAALFGRAPLTAGIGDALGALGRLPNHLGDPASAWNPELARQLPGPVAYWVVLALPTVTIAVMAFVALRIFLRRRAKRRHPLGVDPDTGIARRLRRLEISAPTPGRITLGQIGDRLVAAEAGASLAVVGPSGCGKTAGFAIPALLEWNGPVIATSVKTDLLADTYASRRTTGRVWVYDPTNCSGFPGARWSPLPACVTWAGAQRVAAWLCEAATRWAPAHVTQAGRGLHRAPGKPLQLVGS